MKPFSEKQKELVELIDHYLPNYKSFETIKNEIETTTKNDKDYYHKVISDIQSYLINVERLKDAYEFSSKAYLIVTQMFYESKETFVPEYFLGKKETKFEKKIIVRSSDAVDFIRQFYSDDIEIYEAFSSYFLTEQRKPLDMLK